MGGPQNFWPTSGWKPARCIFGRQPRDVEAGDRPFLASDHQQLAAGVDVQPLGAALLRVVAPLQKGLLAHHDERKALVLLAAPIAVRGVIGNHMRAAGVGDEQAPAVGRKTQAVRIADAMEGADGGRVPAESLAIVENEDGVGVVVADGDPSLVGTEGNAVWYVEPAVEKYPVANRRASEPDDVPGDAMPVVVADEDLAFPGVGPG